jgi:hypothetical protein
MVAKLQMVGAPGTASGSANDNDEEFGRLLAASSAGRPAPGEPAMPAPAPASVKARVRQRILSRLEAEEAGPTVADEAAVAPTVPVSAGWLLRPTVSPVRVPRGDRAQWAEFLEGSSKGEFAAALQSEVEKEGVSLRDLAKSLAVNGAWTSVATLSQWVRGSAVPPEAAHHRVFALERILGASAGCLMDRMEVDRTIHRGFAATSPDVLRGSAEFGGRMTVARRAWSRLVEGTVVDVMVHVAEARIGTAIWPPAGERGTIADGTVTVGESWTIDVGGLARRHNLPRDVVTTATTSHDAARQPFGHRSYGFEWKWGPEHEVREARSLRESHDVARGGPQQPPGEDHCQAWVVLVVLSGEGRCRAGLSRPLAVVAEYPGLAPVTAGLRGLAEPGTWLSVRSVEDRRTYRRQLVAQPCSCEVMPAIGTNALRASGSVFGGRPGGRGSNGGWIRVCHCGVRRLPAADELRVVIAEEPRLLFTDDEGGLVKAAPAPGRVPEDRFWRPFDEDDLADEGLGDPVRAADVLAWNAVAGGER